MFINAKPLTLAQVQRLAPSAFTDHASPVTSDRYHFADTASVLKRIMSMGYHPVSAGQSATTDPNGRPYARHLIRLTHERYLDGRARMVGDVIPQAVIGNSHDRTSALHFSAGLFRLVCGNGMAVDAGSFASIRVLHSDKLIYEHAAEALQAIEDATEKTVVPLISRMQAASIDNNTAREFALAATVLKHGNARPDEADRLLALRREADAKRNLWNVLNVIQENAVRGGYATVDAAGRNRTAAGITSVTRDLEFNQRLWTLGRRVLEEIEA